MIAILTTLTLLNLIMLLIYLIKNEGSFNIFVVLFILIFGWVLVLFLAYKDLNK